MKDKLREIFNVAGKRVVVTGAAGFFGRYMARTFLEVDAAVVLLSRSDQLRAQIEDYGKEFGRDKVDGFQVDFYQRETLVSALEEVVDRFEIDVLVNNAYDLGTKTGFNTPDGKLEASTHEQWQAAFESGIYWAVLTTQVLGRQLVRKRRGSIINVSSMYGTVSPSPALYEGTTFFNPPTYSVNKAGILALTRYVAAFWGEHGVRCNALVPGPFPNRESHSENSVDEDDAFLERLRAKTVLHQLGHPNDLRGALIYLASDASNFVTGQALTIDGGWTIT